MSNDRKDRPYLILLFLSIVVYIGGFFTSAVLRWNAFSYIDFDLATYTQILWNILQGSTYNSILGVDFLGHHAHFFAFLMALFYKIYPHPLTALFLQTFALGFAAFPLFLIARHFFDVRLSVIISILYLLYPPLGYLNAFEFHFPSFSIITTLYCVYFFLKEKYAYFLIFLLATLSVQENLSLVVVFIGLMALLSRRSFKWWGGPIIIGLGYAFFCVKFLFQIRNPDTVQFISLYAHWGSDYIEIIKNMMTRPEEVLAYILQPQKMFWLFQILSPFLFISLLSPLYLLPSLPLFLQHLLSSRATETMIQYHYAAEIIPWVVVAFIFGLKKLSACYQKGSEKLFKGIVVCVVLNISFLYIFSPPQYALFQKQEIVVDTEDQTKKSFIKKVPKDAPLVTTFEFLSHLNHRKHLYSFHHVYHGFYTLSSKEYQLPEHQYYALIDVNDPLTFGSFYTPFNYQYFQKFLEQNRLSVVAVQDNIVLFQADAKQALKLYQKDPLNKEQSLDETSFFSNHEVSLKSIEADIKNNQLWITLRWRALNRIPYDMGQYFDFKDVEGKLIYRFLTPSCYRIYPSQAWKENEEIIEYKYITIPDNIKNKHFRIYIGIYDMKTLGNIFDAKEFLIKNL